MGHQFHQLFAGHQGGGIMLREIPDAIAGEDQEVAASICPIVLIRVRAS